MLPLSQPGDRQYGYGCAVNPIENPLESVDTGPGPSRSPSNLTSKYIVLLFSVMKGRCRGNLSQNSCARSASSLEAFPFLDDKKPNAGGGGKLAVSVAASWPSVGDTFQFAICVDKISVYKKQ
ncbi:hypothetical protein AFLA_009111 [Aspergillus flavus NRRL3357]|nr:hypothetical protein AFLA_009111 [Aspergillus flavus NRRL3357]